MKSVALILYCVGYDRCGNSYVERGLLDCLDKKVIEHILDKIRLEYQGDLYVYAREKEAYATYIEDACFIKRSPKGCYLEDAVLMNLSFLFSEYERIVLINPKYLLLDSSYYKLLINTKEDAMFLRKDDLLDLVSIDSKLLKESLEKLDLKNVFKIHQLAKTLNNYKVVDIDFGYQEITKMSQINYLDKI